jgi:hypothetical protein
MTGHTGCFIRIAKTSFDGAGLFGRRCSSVPTVLREFHEVLQQLQSDLLAFLRMKLGGEHVVLPHGGREIPSVVRAGRDDAGVLRLGKEAVDEIDVASVLDAAEQGTLRLRELNLVPADLRNLESLDLGEANHLASKHSNPGRAAVELLAFLEERLVSNADSKERAARRNEIANSGQQFLSLHGGDAVIERADAGENDAACVLHPVRACCDVNVRSHFAESLFHAAQVAGPVIK